MGRTVGSASLTLLTGAWRFGQTSTPPLTFEVASIKPCAQYDGRTLIQVQPGGGLRTSGATLRFLVTLAYDVRPLQISGGPGWINSDRFDILGKPERGALLLLPRLMIYATCPTAKARRPKNKCGRGCERCWRIVFSL